MKTVFFDVDSQIDFLYPAGALYAPGAETVVAAIVRLNRHAGAAGIPLISTTDAHSEDDPEFRRWPPHCVAGTTGQQKPASTLLEKRIGVPSAPAEFDLQGAQQIVIEKQMLDCFTNANLPEVLRRLGVERCVVYGVVTEVCVKHAVLGLLALGKQVAVVADAIRALEERDGRRALEEIVAGGGRVTTSEAELGA
ncbi:MAG: cysteine hydrolase family protein [Bryobacteraceae bacterium]